MNKYCNGIYIKITTDETAPSLSQSHHHLYSIQTNLRLMYLRSRRSAVCIPFLDVSEMHVYI